MPMVRSPSVCDPRLVMARRPAERLRCGDHETAPQSARPSPWLPVGPDQPSGGLEEGLAVRGADPQRASPRDLGCWL